MTLYNLDTGYDAEMPYNGFAGGGGRRRRINWVMPKFMREYYELMKQADRAQEHPEAAKIQETTKPYTRTINNLIEIDYEALFANRLAKERLERELLEFQELMRQKAVQDKAMQLMLEQAKFEQRKRNMAALMIILAET